MIGEIHSSVFQKWFLHVLGKPSECVAHTTMYGSLAGQTLREDREREREREVAPPQAPTKQDPKP